MPRGFTLTLTMKNAEQAQKALPIMQAAMIYEEINEDGSLSKETIDYIENAMSGGRDDYEICIANLEITGNIISMRCNPCFDQCEGGACGEAIQTIAEYCPDFEFEYESRYEDTIADMYYNESATLKDGNYQYKYSSETPDGGDSHGIKGSYQNDEWDFSSVNGITGYCPECGYPIECDEDEETECCGCGATFTYDELAEHMESDDGWDDEDEDEDDYDEEDQEELESDDDSEDTGSEFHDYVGEEIASVTFDAMQAQFQGKTLEEIAEKVNSAFQGISLMAMMSGGDNAAMMIVGVMGACIKIGCGDTLTDTKKEAIIAVSPEVLRELMQTQSELFFGETSESTYELLDTILASFSMVEDSIYELLLAMAYAGNEVNEKAVEKIKDIYTSHKSDNMLDSLINSGMIKVDNESAYREMRGEKAQKGPKDKNWDTVVLGDGSLEISGYKGKDTSIVIPSEIGGVTVSSLGGYCLSPNKEGLKKAQRKVYENLTKVVISEGIRKIDGYAFESCENLEEIEMHSGLEQIGTRVFNCCEKLKQIIVPETVTFVGEEAFCCGALEVLKMPAKPVRTMGQVSSYHSLTEPVYSGDMTKIYCYPRNSKVADFVLPDGVKFITDGIFGGFDGIKGLKTVRIPEGVEYIGNFTFSNSLKKVYLPNSIKELDFAAFGFEDKIKTVICTNNPYVIEYAKENKIKVVQD